MIVKKVRTVVRQWADEKRREFTGFHGAFFHGSINWMPDERPWAPTSDVDIVFLLDDPEQRPFPVRRFWVKGLVIEHALMAHHDLQTVEQMVGNHKVAAHFTVPTCILLDPDGHLRRLQALAAPLYAHMTWVRHRCESARHTVVAAITAMRASKAVLPPWGSVTQAVIFLGQLPMIADLQNPTWRKSMMGARAVLEAHNLHSLYTSLLQLMGCVVLEQRTVETLLGELTTAYDYATTIHRTPLLRDRFVHPKSRQTVLDGLQALITVDRYQEAIPWMLAMRYCCQMIIGHDAPDSEKARFQEQFTVWLDAIGMRNLENYQGKAEHANDLLDEMMMATETIMAANPQIID